MRQVTTEVIGLKGVMERLRVIGAKVSDLRPFWREEFAPAFFGEIQDRFATGGRSRNTLGQFAGGAWASLAPAYAAWKARFYPGRGILVRTGELRESLRWNGQGLGQDGIFEPSPMSLTVGTRVPYAKFHQTGTRHMPMRRFMDPPEKAKFRPMLQAFVSRVVAESQK